MVVVLALALARSSTSSSPSSDASAPVSVSAVPSDPATVEPCAQVQAALPVQLNGKDPRVVRAVQAVAWGNPAVVLRCGVGRPAELSAGSSAQVAGIDGVNWLVDAGKKSITYTLIDRTVYVEVDLPAGTDPNADMPVLSTAIAKALPDPVCYVQTPLPNNPNLPMCTRR